MPADLSPMSRLSTWLLSSFGGVIITYCVLSIGLFSPFVIFGEVIAPHRQSIELGVIDDQRPANHVENRKFNDYSLVYLPEVVHHLRGPRSGWLALWTNDNELGRPLYQISGLSPAYLPSWAIATLTNSPWRFMTALSLFHCFLSGLFVILLCRETGLRPLAGLIAGSSLATSPLFMYWLTFPMFAAAWCWGAGALWALARLAKNSDLVGWSTLAFSCYNLLMAAYPQLVVFHAYILAGFGACLALRKRRLGTIAAGRFLAVAASAVAVGVILALPVYVDLADARAESARVAPDPSFFTASLPTFGTLTDVLAFSSVEHDAGTVRQPCRRTLSLRLQRV